MGKRKLWVVLAVFLALFGLSPAGISAAGGYAIDINLPACTLTLYQDGVAVRGYPVAIGRPGSPTPVGEYSILRKIRNPVWYPPSGGAPVPSGPNNPLGYRWLAFRDPGYGLHGNSNEASIGHAVSLGCIRLPNRAVEELYEMVPVGTPVRIRYETIEVQPEPQNGALQVTIWPDIYRRGTTTVEQLASKLAAAGYLEVLSAAEMTALLEQAKAGPVRLQSDPAVELDGVRLAGEGLRQNGLLFLPVVPIAEALGKPYAWDSATDTLLLDGRAVTVYCRAGRAYLPLEQIELLLPVRGTWTEGAGVVSLRQYPPPPNLLPPAAQP